MSDFCGCCDKSNKASVVPRLTIYANSFTGGETNPVGKLLAEELSRFGIRQRTMQMEKVVCTVLDKLPKNPIIVGIDVLFNPDYKVDVLKVLCAAYKHKPFSLVWPGTADSNGETLIYAEEGFADYRTFHLCDYDVNYIGTGGKSK